MAEISIVVPMYNVEKYLEECVASLQAQTFSDWQAVLVDDESTDGSARLAMQVCEADPRFHLVSQSNSGPGPGGGRNGGLEMATGEFIMFLDGDDLLPANALEKLRRPLVANPATALTSGRVRRLDGGRQLPTRLSDRAHITTGLRIPRLSPEIVFDPSATNKLFRRKHFDESVGRFPERTLYEDMVAMMRSYLYADQVATLNDVIYIWRVRRDGTSITQSKDRWSDQLDRFTQLLELASVVDELGQIRRALQWKVLAIDLSYTYQLLQRLPEPDGRALHNRTQNFAKSFSPDLEAPLPSEARRRFMALSTDYESAVAALRSSDHISPSRAPYLGAKEEPDSSSIRCRVFSTHVVRNTMIIDALVDGPVDNLQLEAFAPSALEGGTRIFAMPLKRLGRWARCHIPLAKLGRGETHLRISGDHEGRSATGELTRSNTHRLQSALVGSRKQLRSGVSVFFEDAQLHLWRSTEVVHRLTRIDCSRRSVEFTVDAVDHQPDRLLLSAVHRDHDIVIAAEPSKTAEGREGSASISTFIVPRADLLRGRDYVLSVGDRSHPLPTPLTTSASDKIRISRRSALSLSLAERGQLSVALGPCANLRSLVGRARA